ncbi:hypothetical protein IEQ34_006383 [Dendrobium chrysotoxum]|uniref:Uncharacterized protein n=1 Tax=Dendrobium chrysotoxum TaxID=161865 RepID=A0AAV7HFS3_DENCH|nr:hypothetical protein IEQ34_006383 [Dendrobium chrysotoxum]
MLSNINLSIGLSIKTSKIKCLNSGQNLHTPFFRVARRWEKRGERGERKIKSLSLEVMEFDSSVGPIEKIIHLQECVSLHPHLAKEPTTSHKLVIAIDMETYRLTPLVATNPTVEHIVDDSNFRNVAPCVHVSVSTQETMDIPNVLIGNPVLLPL